MVWHIGNTTVRTPYRLRAALEALVTSHLHGNLLGSDNEQAFADLLYGKGLVLRSRGPGSQDIDRSSHGRKWRVALSQLGFLTPHLTIGHRQGVDENLAEFTEGVSGLTGRPYEITPSGQRLVEANDVIAQQQAFLRALAAYRIPSPLEPRYNQGQFSPLRFTLEVLSQLESEISDPFVSYDEMALFVQRSSFDDGVTNVAHAIQELRSVLSQPNASRTQLIRQSYLQAVLDDDPDVNDQRIQSRAKTLGDYADLNIRYLKSTGLFRSRGRGITLSPERIELIRRLADDPISVYDDRSYMQQLWYGASLPTDEISTAIAATRNLEQVIRERGGEIEDVDTSSLDAEDLQIVIHRLEEQLQRLDEENFAHRQVDQVEEIVGYMNAILARGRNVLGNGRVISIPRGEMPAYMEWVIWRAFLAIDSLENNPWETRRFEIDQDLLPIHHAPGGGPDMSFEFSDSIVVVEVTLTSSSRQEAAEGEPVRRHVARYAESSASGKSVYGLFIAPTVDTNTAHTFRSGEWYRSDDSKINLHIVPMQLEDFRDFFKAILLDPTNAPSRLRQLLVECRVEANQDAPRWKSAISTLTKRAAETSNQS